MGDLMKENAQQRMDARQARRALEALKTDAEALERKVLGAELRLAESDRALFASEA